MVITGKSEGSDVRKEDLPYIISHFSFVIEGTEVNFRVGSCNSWISWIVFDSALKAIHELHEAHEMNTKQLSVSLSMTHEKSEMMGNGFHVSTTNATHRFFSAAALFCNPLAQRSSVG